MDRVWLAKKLSLQKINIIAVPLKVRGIGSSKHKLEEFVLITIYIPGLDQESTEIYAFINFKLHPIDGWKANILVDNDVLYTKSFAINFFNASIYIHNCGIKIGINTKHQSEFLKRKILINDSTFVSPQLETLIAF